ncbi:unnamed protein product [Rotaria sordida]|uniref:Uncharacterized protein n=1 Tax=Rotaria sordida TaxID=392033 RepID=A0A819IAY2_9BILA|nr:unnamed protein product [Rotaria sordida]
MMDEVFSLDILYADEYVPEQLYQLARQGLCSQLDARLHELSNSTEYLAALTWHGQEQLSLLMVAALNGYDDIVRVLLTHCDSTHQIELKGQVILYDAKLVKGATALYCACYRGHFTVAKTLIELGQANVKQDIRDHPYYPLFIHATIMNRQDIVHFLLENKYADVNETKSNDCDESTALICAASRGYTSLVKYLIENGADVNYSSRNQNFRSTTAIMCATRCGHIDALRLLYNAGANTNITHITEDTLLVIAAKNKHYSIVNFLLEQSIYNTVDDLELAACSLFDISSSVEQMNVVFDLLRIALQKRQLLQIPKVCIQSMDIYNYEQECQTIDELDRIKADHDRIFIEILLIQERICSSRKDITIIKSLENYSDRLADKKEFDKCLNVYIHMFYCYQQTNINNNLARFVWLYCKMLTENRIIPIHRFIQVCYLTFDLTETKYIERTICNALFFVIIAIKILEQKGITKEEQTLIYSWIRDLCRHRLTTPSGQTLLHLCVDENTNYTLNFRRRDTIIHIKFPNESALRLLLACGNRWLDLDEIESSSSDTPLHIICKRNRDQKIIKLLLNSGCHMDCVNKDGKIPSDYVYDKEIKALFTTKPTPDRLKCFCARIIANKRLNTANIVNGFGEGTLILISSCFSYAIDLCSEKEQHSTLNAGKCTMLLEYHMNKLPATLRISQIISKFEVPKKFNLTKNCKIFKSFGIHSLKDDKHIEDLPLECDGKINPDFHKEIFLDNERIYELLNYVLKNVNQYLQEAKERNSQLFVLIDSNDNVTSTTTTSSTSTSTTSSSTTTTSTTSTSTTSTSTSTVATTSKIAFAI